MSGLGQLVDKDNKIFQTSKFLKKYLNFFLETISFRDNLIFLTLKNEYEQKFTAITKKVYLATGIIQTLDLLYRSGLFDDIKFLQIEEYPCDFNFSFNNKTSISKKHVQVKFNFHGIMKHFLNSNSSFVNCFRIFNNFIYLNQNFLPKKNYLNIRYDKKVNKFMEIKSKKEFFGSSVHYSNVIVNNSKTLFNYLKSINKNLIGVSMPFIRQNLPGPVSNDLINHCIKYGK